MIKMIWCEDKNHGIAKNGVIPWNNVSDMQFFKEQTFNHYVVMGRTTWQTLKFKPLKNRQNIVLSSNITKEEKEKYPEVYFLENKEQVLQLANDTDLYVIGGKKIYELFLSIADELIISSLDQDYDCDLFMNIDLSKWFAYKTFSTNQLTINFYTRKRKEKA